MSGCAFACLANSGGGGYVRSSRSIVSIAWCCSVSLATGYASALLGIGDPIRPIGAAPTGITGTGDIPFTTPAAEVYHATAAVTIPAQPPACSHQAVPPCERLKKPIT